MADTTTTEQGTKSGGKTGLTDAFREHFSGDAPFSEKAKSFYKARPVTSIAFLGAAAAVVLSTLRGGKPSA